jgi:hypothetical protein
VAAFFPRDMCKGAARMDLPCGARRKTKAPLCADDPACRWRVGTGCVAVAPVPYTAPAWAEEKAKFCRCVLHVLGRTRRGAVVTNPWAICASKRRGVGTTTGGRPCHYAWHNIPTSEARAYALHHARELPYSARAIERMPRETLVRTLRAWYERKKLAAAATSPSRRRRSSTR